MDVVLRRVRELVQLVLPVGEDEVGRILFNIVLCGGPGNRERDDEDEDEEDDARECRRELRPSSV